MIKFIKTPDPKTGQDYTKVSVTILTNEYSLDDLIDEFGRFLVAIGFSNESVLDRLDCENCGTVADMQETIDLLQKQLDGDIHDPD